MSVQRKGFGKKSFGKKAFGELSGHQHGYLLRMIIRLIINSDHNLKKKMSPELIIIITVFKL